MTIDDHTKNILQSQEAPTKTYLDLNKRMVEGYLSAIDNDGPEKLNMTQATYDRSKAYLETTKKGIDTALLAYEAPELITQNTCTNCSNSQGENNYASDPSAYVQGIFVEATDTSGAKTVVNTVTSAAQIEKVSKTYTNNLDINNDKVNDIIAYDTNSIFIKYGDQDTEHLSKAGNSITRDPSTAFYSYASEHPRNRYIASLDQLRDNSDTYGFTQIGDIKIKIVDRNKEVK